ncbi:MAG: sulfur oxidation c-type cytochrome SoxA [Alphaproteobacteria bacterium]|nr:sulfur oxidation c-type cytochrome SoxA [Alphaproteobacteria bacterium]
MTRLWPLPLFLAAIGAALAAEQPPRSGLDYATPGVRAMQADDFANPGMLWVAEGEALWNAKDGAGGASCQSCHGAVSAMAGIAYPRRDPRDPSKLMNLETRIEQCRVDRMGAPPFGYESRELLALTSAIRNQARGRPVAVVEDAAAIAAGQAHYNRRRGAFDLSCGQCHEERAGKHLRDETISQGQSNGFPAYRLRWQSLGSLHRRFQACNSAVGAEPSPLGSQEYIALEWYLAWRGRSLAVETPAVRQ